MIIQFESEAVCHLIRKISGAQARINARNKIKEITVKSLKEEADKKRDLIRSLISESETVKRPIRAEISKIEIHILEIESGKFGF